MNLLTAAQVAQRWQCFECSAPAENAHHVVPQSKGGTKTVPLCLSCHGKAHDRMMPGRELTRAALSHKKAKGELTGKAPWGAKVGEDGVTLEPNEREAEVLRLVRELRAEGMTLRAITSEIEAQGHRNRAGNPHGLTAVARMLKANP